MNSSKIIVTDIKEFETDYISGDRVFFRTDGEASEAQVVNRLEQVEFEPATIVYDCQTKMGYYSLIDANSDLHVGQSIKL